MIRSFNPSNTFKTCEILNDTKYRFKWARKDEEEQYSSYSVQEYNYKPSIDIVIDEILNDCNHASIQEIKEICEFLKADSIEYCKKVLIKYIEDYDKSDNVNSFSLNGKDVWLDKDTRVGLMNSTTIAKNLGNEKTTLWLGITKLEINCDVAIQLLSSLEMYALECYNVTASHKAEIEEITNIEDLLKYDYTKGYPNKLQLNF